MMEPTVRDMTHKTLNSKVASVNTRDRGKAESNWHAPGREFVETFLNLMASNQICLHMIL